MKNYLLILLILFSPFAFGSSAVNPANTGSLGGYQGNSEISYVPTFGGYTVQPTNISIKWSRIGDKLYVHGSYTGGTSTTAVQTISLPVGLTMDPSKLSSLSEGVGDYTNLLGTVNSVYASGYGHKVFYDGSDTAKVYIAYQMTADTFTKNFANAYTPDGRTQTFHFMVPIQGWTAGGSGGSGGTVSQLRRTGGNAGIGSTNTNVMKWGTAVAADTFGANLSYTETAANGGYVLVGAAGDVDISYTFGDTGATTTFGIIIDPTGSTYANGGAVLTGNVRLMGPSTGEMGVVAVGIANTSNSFQTLHHSQYVAAGAKIWFMVNSGAPGSANSQFTVKLRTY